MFPPHSFRGFRAEVQSLNNTLISRSRCIFHWLSLHRRPAVRCSNHRAFSERPHPEGQLPSRLFLRGKYIYSFLCGKLLYLYGCYQGV
ncbi:hypothetical protein BN903_28 [Halorubrum sp. AJ67]|nr:hypothetical protein BN903_28 [Halorubrum sp. AJ67]